MFELSMTRYEHSIISRSKHLPALAAASFLAAASAFLASVMTQGVNTVGEIAKKIKEETMQQ